MNYSDIALYIGVAVLLSFVFLHFIWLAYALGWNPPPWMGAFMFRLFVPPRWAVAILLFLETGFFVLLFSGALHDAPNPFPRGSE